MLTVVSIAMQSALEAIEGESATTPANDSDDESDDGDDEGDARMTESDKYLAPVEIEAQMKLLWHNNADILDFIWSRSVNSGMPGKIVNREGWKLFFTRTILVPPSRFRPYAKVREVQNL